MNTLPLLTVIMIFGGVVGLVALKRLGGPKRWLVGLPLVIAGLISLQHVAGRMDLDLTWLGIPVGRILAWLDQYIRPPIFAALFIGILLLVMAAPKREKKIKDED